MSTCQHVNMSSTWSVSTTLDLNKTAKHLGRGSMQLVRAVAGRWVARAKCTRRQVGLVTHEEHHIMLRVTARTEYISVYLITVNFIECLRRSGKRGNAVTNVVTRCSGTFASPCAPRQRYSVSHTRTTTRLVIYCVQFGSSARLDGRTVSREDRTTHAQPSMWPPIRPRIIE